jgi:hypothetical protein
MVQQPLRYIPQWRAPVAVLANRISILIAPKISTKTGNPAYIHRSHQGHGEPRISVDNISHYPVGLFECFTLSKLWRQICCMSERKIEIELA